MLENGLMVAVSAFLLWVGADWIVGSASAIARRWGIPELVIGLTVVAFGTSAPEFLVTATAAFRGLEDISLSNVVGSNIFNLGFILGAMALIKPLPTHRLLVWRDGIILFAATAAIMLVALTGALPRWFGVLLMSSLASYLLFLFMRGKTLVVEEDDEHTATWKDYPKLVLGFLGIAAGGHFMVDAASAMAEALGVSRWVIGVTVVAAGTSLPEFVTCLAASIKGKNDMLLGNLLGSDFFNFAGVLGLTLILRPMNVPLETVSNLGLLVGMVALVIFFMRTGWQVGRVEGAILMALSLGRWFKGFLF